MPKHHKQGVGAELVGTPDELIKLLIKNPKDQKWVLNEVINEGPPHKQVLTALLLKRLYKLVKTLEKSSGAVFELQKGNPVTTEAHEETMNLPFGIPISLGSKVDVEAIVESVEHAPAHELLAYTLCLQVIEWGISQEALFSNKGKKYQRPFGR